MSKPIEPVLTKLIVSLITSNKDVIKTVLRKLEDKFGAIDFLTEAIDFNHTDYYKKEMGEGLFRKLASFERLIKPDELAIIKIFTNSLEDEHLTIDGKRIINIDPGYIAMEKMVLATCKNFSHRICLQNGVYADLIFIYKNGGFQSLEWTFPDYAKNTMKEIFSASGKFSL